MMEAKYYVGVYGKDDPLKVRKEVLESLKGAVGGRMMARMKREAISCPVLNRERPFLVCFACDNFIRRLKGEVHCLGEPIPDIPDY